MKFIIERNSNQEEVKIYLEEKSFKGIKKTELGWFDHDSDGYHGMEQAENLTIAIANHLNIPVVVND